MRVDCCRYDLMKYLILILCLGLLSCKENRPITRIPPSPPAVQSSDSVVKSTVSSGDIQETRWKTAKVRPEFIMRLDKAISLYQKNKRRTFCCYIRHTWKRS